MGKSQRGGRWGCARVECAWLDSGCVPGTAQPQRLDAGACGQACSPHPTPHPAGMNMAGMMAPGMRPPMGGPPMAVHVRHPGGMGMGGMQGPASFSAALRGRQGPMGGEGAENRPHGQVRAPVRALEVCVVEACGGPRGLGMGQRPWCAARRPACSRACSPYPLAALAGSTCTPRLAIRRPTASMVGRASPRAASTAATCMAACMAWPGACALAASS